MPISSAPAQSPAPMPVGQGTAEIVPEQVRDDRAEIEPGDRVLLIVENDPTFAQYLIEIGREHGYKCVLSTEGNRALSLRP